ncbi:MAG: inositol monophosphatase family protein, partial [Thermodesulfovibrionales bacterium]
EEYGGQGIDDFCWVIDPLDGTTNFIRGFPVFAISIALLYKGDILIGLIYDPNRHETFEAIKGQGAFLNGKRVQVSNSDDKTSTLIATGFPFRQKGLVDKYCAIFRDVLFFAGDLRRAGSASLDLAYVACGRCDGFFEFGLKIWDIAAGVLIVKEAGGEVSGFSDAEELFKTGNIIAGSRYVFQPLKDIIKRHI